MASIHKNVKMWNAASGIVARGELVYATTTAVFGLLFPFLTSLSVAACFPFSSSSSSQRFHTQLELLVFFFVRNFIKVSPFEYVTPNSGISDHS